MEGGWQCSQGSLGDQDVLLSLQSGMLGRWEEAAGKGFARLGDVVLALLLTSPVDPYKDQVETTNQNLE